MIEIEDFAKVEVMQLVRDLSDVLTDHKFEDGCKALAILQAFIIDNSSDKTKAKDLAVEMIDFVLKRAAAMGAMKKAAEANGHARHDL